MRAPARSAAATAGADHDLSLPEPARSGRSVPIADGCSADGAALAGCLGGLAPAEQASWRAFLAASQLLFDQLDRELQQAAGISLAYFLVLCILADQPRQALRMSDLARSVRFGKTRLSEAVARLEARGWVRREGCPTDRRSTVAVLTDAGAAVLATAAPQHVAGVRRHLLDRLGPGQVEQLGTLSRLVATPLLEAAGFDPRAC